MKQQKSYYPKASEVDQSWRVIDAEGQVLGRLASEIAMIVKGKDKPAYTPSVDVGDYVVVINASKLRVTGNKLSDKKYYRHSGYPGGLKEESLGDLLERKPCDVVYKAVWGMLPHNRLGRQMMKKVKIYEGSEHPHIGQTKEVKDVPVAKEEV